MTGIAVVALVVFALGAMHGMRAQFAAHPGAVALYLGLAFVVNAGFQLLGAALFARTGLDCAATVGLISGNRNIGLAWAAVGSGLPPLVELFFAMSVLPIYMLPAVAKPVLAWARRPRGRRLAAVPSGGIASPRQDALAEAVAHRPAVLRRAGRAEAAPAPVDKAPAFGLDAVQPRPK